MSQMRPSILDQAILTDPFRGAERRVFDLCKALPKQCYVLYGAAWIEHRSNGGTREGEADFVIISPDIGLVVLEVKGGRIGRDSEGWFTLDRAGVRHPIKDPIGQAQACKHQFLRTIRNHPGFSNRFVPAAHMVCFPDVSARDLVILPECPRELQICADDLHSLLSALRKGSSLLAATSKNSRLAPADCEAIADILKPNFLTPSRWAVTARLQRSIMDKLTEEQGAVLSWLDSNRLIGLTGPAGCGKTIVALRWCSDRAEMGHKVLCTVPTPLLKEYYRNLLPPGRNLECLSHNEIVDSTSIGEQAWDTIVIDEAQDLSFEAWDLFEQAMKRNPKASLLAVYDSNQRLRMKGSFYLPDGMVEVNLHRVLRNTRQIGELSSRFYRSDREVELLGPEGPDVQEIPIRHTDELPDAVSSFIVSLVRNHDFEFRDIVVLFGRNTGRLLNQHGSARGVSYRQLRQWWGTGHDHPIVACGNIATFRGMESSVVILIEIDDLLDKDLIEACYVGMSRARHVLAVVGLPGTLQRIRSI